MSRSTFVRQPLGSVTAGYDRMARWYRLAEPAIPDRDAVLDNVWEMLRPGGRLVVMDAGLPPSRVGRALTGVAELVARIFPGDPYSRAWEDLTRLSPTVATERFQLGTYFICAVRKEDPVTRWS